MQITDTPPPAYGPCSPQALNCAGRLARYVALGFVMTCLSCVATTSATAQVTRSRIPATQRLVVLLRAHQAFQAPDLAAPRMALVAARRPITGERTTLPVIGQSLGPGSERWLRVMLPGRPNGSAGWIFQQGTRAAQTSWYVSVDLARRRVSVYRDGRIMRSFLAVVGKASTPTPTGRFFVEETLQMSAGEPGGPFALALSARSNALQEFEGGPGQIALHGRDGLGGTLGTAASHGCIRLRTTSIGWLAARIGPGVPVMIR
jgi:L,D-transpeptidase catalytic domain